MQQKTRGIVLHSLKYGDNSLIVKILTRDYGLKTFMVRGFRGKKSSMQASLFMPLTIINLDISSRKTTTTFNTIKEAQCFDPMHLLHADFAKQAMALFIAEVLYKTIADEEPHPELYDYVEETLHYINLSGSIPAVFAHYFLVNYSRHLGLYPNVYSEEATHFFDMRDGVFTASKEQHSDFLLHEESKALKLILSSSVENLQDIKMSNLMRKNLLDGLLHYYRIHLLNFREIKSHVVLAEVLRG